MAKANSQIVSMMADLGLNAKGLDLEDVKKMFAKQHITKQYVDQFDMRAYEALFGRGNNAHEDCKRYAAM
jgi:hypothetical protein